MDVLCQTDLDAFGRDINDPVAELAQDVIHTLLESYGSNIAMPQRSIGLEDGLSGPLDVRTLKHRIETKLVEDPRIDAARADVSSADNQTVQVSIAIQADAGQLGVTLLFDSAGNYLGWKRTS